MGHIKHHFNDRSDPVIAKLDLEVDAYNNFENPTPDQTRQLQNSLANANLFPKDRVDGKPSELLNFSATLVSNSDLAQRAVIGFGALPEGSATPEQSRAMEISLNRLGYSVPLDGKHGNAVQAGLSQYRSDYPLPVTEQQIEVIVADVGGKIPLDAKDGMVITRHSAVPDLVKTELDIMEKAGTLAGPLKPEELNGLNKAIIEQLDKYSQPIPQLKAEKVAELQANQSATRPIILRVTPDEVSKDNFLPIRMQMRAEWEAGNIAIEAAGGRVEAIDGSSLEGGKREIFTRNRFTMVGDTAYLPDITARPVDYETNSLGSEVDQVRKNLQEQGIKTVDVKGAWFEGGNVVMHNKSNTVFMGLEPGIDNGSAKKLIEKINQTQPEKYNMVIVPLVEYSRQGIYHLDLSLSDALPNGKYLFDEKITDPHTRERVENIIGKDNIIPITREEAIQGDGNMLRINNTAIMSNTSDRLQNILKAEGLSFVDQSDFTATGNHDIDTDISKGGLLIGNGGMRCMGEQIGTEPNPAFTAAKQPSLGLQPTA